MASFQEALERKYLFFMVNLITIQSRDDGTRFVFYTLLLLSRLSFESDYV